MKIHISFLNSPGPPVVHGWRTRLRYVTLSFTIVKLNNELTLSNFIVTCDTESRFCSLWLPSSCALWRLEWCQRFSYPSIFRHGPNAKHAKQDLLDGPALKGCSNRVWSMDQRGYTGNRFWPSWWDHSSVGPFRKRSTKHKDYTLLS